MFSFAFAPTGWALADGAILPIQQNQALFTLIRNFYGGDGTKTFALPDLRGRTPVGNVPQASQGSSYAIGTAAGLETVTLTTAQMPMHSHDLRASTTAGTTGNAAGGFIATVALDDLTPKNQRTLYAEAASGSLIGMAPDAISKTGGGEAHYNMQPFAVANFCISLTGLYPTRP
nr:tail fiber protein [Ancylobacter lacus]